jgi:glycosyltransferase involved in cell wall biosynthesis
LVADVDRPRVRWDRTGDVTVVRLEVPGVPRHVGFDAPEVSEMRDAVVARAGSAVPLVWLYTPLALPLARELNPDVIVYDVMDDLAAFRGASPHMRQAQREALKEADVVFAGGRSLHRTMSLGRDGDVHLFPSGVEPEHFRFKGPRPSRARPVAGYVGVIDERIDLELLAQLADRLTDWEIRVVGPVAKIDPTSLPQRPNLVYPGPAAYDDLACVLAGFDVAIMPFALNEATRSISPTKTLEYLAAGLAVVSTRVADVEADFGTVVTICDEAQSFADACRALLRSSPSGMSSPAIESMLKRHHWDLIAERMVALIDNASSELIEQSA